MQASVLLQTISDFVSRNCSCRGKAEFLRMFLHRTQHITWQNDHTSAQVYSGETNTQTRTKHKLCHTCISNVYDIVPNFSELGTRCPHLSCKLWCWRERKGVYKNRFYCYVLKSTRAKRLTCSGMDWLSIDKICTVWSTTTYSSGSECSESCLFVEQQNVSWIAHPLEGQSCFQARWKILAFVKGHVGNGKEVLCSLECASECTFTFCVLIDFVAEGAT